MQRTCYTELLHQVCKVSLDTRALSAQARSTVSPSWVPVVAVLVCSGGLGHSLGLPGLESGLLGDVRPTELGHGVQDIAHHLHTTETDIEIDR